MSCHDGWHQQRPLPEAYLVHHSTDYVWFPACRDRWDWRRSRLHRKGLSSSPHPGFAIPRQSLPTHHIPAIPLARCDQTLLAPPRAASDRRPSCWLLVPPAKHSIGCQCAAHTGWLTTSADHSGLAVLLSDEQHAPGSTGTHVPIPHHSVPTVSFVSLTFSSVTFPFIVSQVSE